MFEYIFRRIISYIRAKFMVVKVVRQAKHKQWHNSMTKIYHN